MHFFSGLSLLLSLSTSFVGGQQLNVCLIVTAPKASLRAPCIPGRLQQNDESIPDKIGPVSIVHKITNNFYPADWVHDPKIKPIAKEIDRQQLKRAIPLIKEFIKDYPEPVLKKNLSTINLCKQLQFYGKDFGGTNSSDGVYICVRTIRDGYTNVYVLSSLHHEFSSILMRNYLFPKKEWAKLNPSGFKYADDAVGFLGKESLLEPGEDYFKIGFICLYSQASMEEDFNTIADYLFNQRDELLKIAQTHSRMKAKIVLAMKFYKSIDQRFSFGKLESLNP